MQFQDVHVVVTGGTGALGRAVAGKLLDAGAICHVPNFAAEELAGFPHSRHERMRITKNVDLGDERSVGRFYAELPQLWASIHVAGGFAMAGITDTSAEQFAAQFRLNAETCFLCCQAAVRTMRKTGKGGRIVNVAARPALEPRLGAGMSAYTAAKAAVAALTQSLGEELAAEGIWVNAVAPSILDTPANRAAMPKAEHAKWPKVEEVAEAIVFLASSANRVVRGAVVPVYGKT